MGRRTVRGPSRCGSRRCAPTSIGENGAPVRRSAGAEAARVMADLVVEGARTLTFVRSRRGAELTALGARARLDDMLRSSPTGWRRTARDTRRGPPRTRAGAGQRRAAWAWRPPMRWIGVDIAGLDAVVLAGFPGTRHVVLAAGRAVGPAGTKRAGRADRPRRSVGHLPGTSSRMRCWTSRSRRW